MKVVIELGQVGVELTIGPDASQLNCVFGTLARFLVLGWILHPVVAFRNPACRPYTSVIIKLKELSK